MIIALLTIIVLIMLFGPEDFIALIWLAIVFVMGTLFYVVLPVGIVLAVVSTF